MGTCWPKLKFKSSKHCCNQSNFNANNYDEKQKKAEKHAHVSHASEQLKHDNKMTNCSKDDEQQHTMASSKQQNHVEYQKKAIILQPRRDLESTLSNCSSAATGSPAITTSSSTATSNFKQFCKNSADKLTHKLSFTHNHRNTASSAAASNKQCDTNNDESRILSLFDKYKDTKDSMLANGIQQLCDDLSLNPDDFKILLLAWKLNAKQMCTFTREEFVNGFKLTLKVDNLKDLKVKLASLEEDLVQNQEDFKDLYRWSFDFGLDSDTGERAIPLEMAISLWQLVYINQEPPILHKWLKFLKEHSNAKGIPRDTWNMFPLFSKSIGEFNYHLYDDSEAWPCLFDDFVQSETQAKLSEVKLDINNNNSNIDRQTDRA